MITKFTLLVPVLLIIIHLHCTFILNDEGNDSSRPGSVNLNSPTNLYPTAVTLSWTQSQAKNFAAYRVFYDVVSDVSEESSILATNIFLKSDTSYLLTGLWENTTYYAKIFTLNGESVSESNQIKFTTPDCSCGTFTNERDKGMVKIPSGCFVSKDSTIGTISYDYFMDTTEVTEAQWFKIMNDSIVNSIKPMTNISLYQAIFFCNKKSLQNGLDTCYTYGGVVIDTLNGDILDVIDIDCDLNKNGFRIPIEDEWEYAYRAGVVEEFYWGKDGNTSTVYPWTTSYPNTKEDSVEISEYAWWQYNNNPEGTKDVGQLKPNGWYLYDMAGNVEELIWNLSSLQKRASTRTDYKGPEQGPMSSRKRIVRGGGFGQKNHNLTAWFRDKDRSPSEHFSDDTGFRTVRRAN